MIWFSPEASTAITANPVVTPVSAATPAGPHAGALQFAQLGVPRVIVADGAHEFHYRPHGGRRYRLVGTLAAVAVAQRPARDSLAGARAAGSPARQVGVDRTHHDHSHHAVECRHGARPGSPAGGRRNRDDPYAEVT